MPYFDIIVKDEEKSKLREIPMSALIRDRAQAETIKSLMRKETIVSTNKLLKIVPHKNA